MVCVESRKMEWVILFAKEKWRHRGREQIYGCQEGEGCVGGIGILESTHIHY